MLMCNWGYTQQHANCARKRAKSVGEINFTLRLSHNFLFPCARYKAKLFRVLEQLLRQWCGSAKLFSPRSNGAPKIPAPMGRKTPYSVCGSTAAVLSATWPAVRSREDILLHLSALPSFSWAVVGREMYKTPEKGRTHHYHAHIVFNDVVTTKWGELDDVGGIHGHYQSVRGSPGNHLAYVMKENDYLCKAALNREDLMREAILLSRMPAEERVAASLARIKERKERFERQADLLRK